LSIKGSILLCEASIYAKLGIEFLKEAGIKGFRMALFLLKIELSSS